jgi:hypothetical protein
LKFFLDILMLQIGNIKHPVMSRLPTATEHFSLDSFYKRSDVAPFRGMNSYRDSRSALDGTEW